MPDDPRIRPLRNLIDDMHPVAILRDRAFEEAERHAVYENGAYVVTNERKLLTYGRLWLIMLAVWDEINNQMDPGCPSFDDQLHAAFVADTNDVLEAMHG